MRQKEMSLCPLVAAANIQGVFDYCLVSIAEDASTLSDVGKRIISARGFVILLLSGLDYSTLSVP